MSKDLDRSELLHLMSLKEVFGGFAHEIAQPLNAMMIASQVLKMKVERSVLPTEEQSFLCKRLDLIADQVRRATEIVDELRSFSRDDESTREGPTDLKVLFRKVHGLMAQQFISRGIELTWTAAPTLPLTVLSPHLTEGLLVLALAFVRDVVQRMASQPPQGTGISKSSLLVAIGAEEAFLSVRFRCLMNGPAEGGLPAELEKTPSMRIAASLLSELGGSILVSQDSLTLRLPSERDA